MTAVTIRDCMTDPALFGNQFSGDTWSAWRALFAGFDGLPLDNTEREHWQALTGLAEAPTQRGDELYLVVGRRGGKTNTAALRAVYDAAFTDYTDRLAPGEVATVMVLAADRKQARSCFRYISGLLHANPMLERMIVREDRETIELSNRTAIEVHTASFRAVRGYTVACCIADEVAFWRSEDSANPDFEIINAIRPAMATLDGRLVVLSSPYSKRGVLWDAYRRYYGKPGPIVVAKAPSRTMNPALPQRVIDQAMERDPEAAKAEYLAEFRSDLETFIQRETIENAMRSHPPELPHDRRYRYFAFADPAGGGKDEFTLSIGHTDGQTVVVDLVRGRHGVPAAIVAEYSDLLVGYGIRKVWLDKYAGSWPTDEFSRHGIEGVPADQARTGLYLDTLAALNSDRVQLPPDTRMLNQFINLERRTSRNGRETVDHPSGSHDDRCNAAAGLISHLSAKNTARKLAEWV